MPKTAIPGKAKPKNRSAKTDRFWPCPAGGLPHPAKRIACRIMKGPRAYFCRCPADQSATFFGLEWHEGMGLTEAQANAQGYTTF